MTAEMMVNAHCAVHIVCVCVCACLRASGCVYGQNGKMPQKQFIIKYSLNTLGSKSGNETSVEDVVLPCCHTTTTQLYGVRSMQNANVLQRHEGNPISISFTLDTRLENGFIFADNFNERIFKCEIKCSYGTSMHLPFTLCYVLYTRFGGN